MEPNAVVDIEQPGFRRRSQRARVDGESVGRPPQQRGVPERLRCRQQHESLRRFGQCADAPQVALLQLTRKVARRGWSEAPGSLGAAHPLRQLDQRERIALGFGDDPVADAVVESARHGSRQQSARIGLIEALD